MTKVKIDYGQGIGAAARQLRSNEADSGTAESPVFSEAKNDPWVMHEYDKLQEGHTARETWCKIKSDSGTEYWVNKDDFDFKSKDGSKIGLVYYDKWEDFFCEINPSKYGEFKIKKDEKEDGKNIYYLLGHLSEYAPQLTINTKVYPGMVVGKVGNTGNCRTQNRPITPQERAKGIGSHLHLSLYKTKLDFERLYLYDANNYITHGNVLFNPFNHTEGRKYK